MVSHGPGGRGVDLIAALELLGGLGVLQALVEAGGELAGALVAAGLVDRLVTYVGPVVARAQRPVPRSMSTPVAMLSDAPRFELVDVARFGDDVRLDYRATATELGRLMFTGIVEELGTVRACTPREGVRGSRSRHHSCSTTRRSAHRSR